jgi:hypothetical protein
MPPKKTNNRPKTTRTTKNTGGSNKGKSEPKVSSSGEQKSTTVQVSQAITKVFNINNFDYKKL